MNWSTFQTYNDSPERSLKYYATNYLKTGIRENTMINLPLSALLMDLAAMAGAVANAS